MAEKWTQTLADTLATTSAVAVISTAVGYNIAAKGPASEDLMPKLLGVAPLDMTIGLGGHLLGFLLPVGDTYKRALHKAGDGGLSVLTMSAAQSAGEQLYQSMNGAGAMRPRAISGGAPAPRQMAQTRPAEIRDANGRHVPVANISKWGQATLG